MRADQLLVDRGLAASRSQAQRLIAAGLAWRVGNGPWKTVAKNRDEVPDQAELQLQDDAESRYVSRGGLKLEGALRSSGVDPTGLVCLDVGQSTGGFTDCLLQHGAARVVGVDVGHDQVHPRVRGDERVHCIEGVNARALEAEDLGDELPEQGFGLIVGDLSFISQTLVLPAVVPVLADDGALLMLVKPQFELQPGQVGKGGIVRDESLYPVVRARIEACCAELGLAVAGWWDSAISGGDGNREFWILGRKQA
ncbi:TlyA family RNA methyltransferase [Pseudorhodoferax sp. Leaf265]|uniref:TlyA family RNA methyltransferase n=1 Tax=Pseudorhodoferax sp. Leaf265 TaxID=1736315 RepID=UPI0006F1F989|nr:TlyA family RNA methyltransferase [Pseudorhodoferax sp. Leaf265]KQP03213.1 hemolysin [Pseudorhodoferax sp. Leaf265]PZP97903.1 MAG: TlyA family RNA methyltransferase [Variovorax paradoxus]PZQ09197.1 MAG: TlyA family RNA methyltransferase [Variovorax paradoxus]